jgi:hypothetical protein
MSENPAPEWCADGLRFECQRCGACRTGEPGYVWVTLAEAEEIAQFLGLSAEEFGEKYLRNAGSHDSLIELPDGRCIFYRDKSCEVYPVRPTQCRTFPFWQSVVVSLQAWTACQRKCPGIGKGRLYSHDEIQKILRSTSAESGRPGLRPR